MAHPSEIAPALEADGWMPPCGIEDCTLPAHPLGVVEVSFVFGLGVRLHRMLVCEAHHRMLSDQSIAGVSVAVAAA